MQRTQGTLLKYLYAFSIMTPTEKIYTDLKRLNIIIKESLNLGYNRNNTGKTIISHGDVQWSSSAN